MHSRGNNIKFTSYNDANEVADELFDSVRSRYKENLQTSMRGSDFTFDLVQMMYYKFHEVNFARGGSYIGSADWIKKRYNNKSKRRR